MIITDVHACQPDSPGVPNDWRKSMGQILIAVKTDLGITGFGVGGGGKAGIHVVRTVLRELLLNRSPEPVESLWDEMYRATLAFGRKGLAIMALSGVDLALWDLRGKAARQPIIQILGGTPGKKIPVYTTVWGPLPEGPLEKFPAYKIHLGKSGETSPQELESFLRIVRKKVGNAGLMIDAWMQWTVPFTLELAHRVADLHLTWIEEPLSPDDTDGYCQLAEQCPIPIAGGEHEFTSFGFQDLIRRKLHRVLQPDVCWCGGLTELVKIYRQAQMADLRVCPHRGAEVWGLHPLAALDSNPLAEIGRPWLTWVKNQPKPLNGFIELSDQPGFGVVFD